MKNTDEDQFNRYQSLPDETTESVDSGVKAQISGKISYSRASRRNPKQPKLTKEKTNSNLTKPSRMNIDLVIGDSMVKNIDSEKLETAAKQKTVCHSYSGATVEQIHQKIEEYWNEDHNYHRVVIHVGTNYLPHEKPEEVAKKMETLITKVQTHANEVAASIVIRRYDNKVRASNITHYNNLLHQLCIKHNVTYIDNDCIDRSMLNGSNLHLNKHGDKSLGGAFCAFLKPKRIPVPPTSYHNEHFLWEASNHQRRDCSMYLKHVKKILNN